MGHSLKGDVDLAHYNAQSPDDLKKIYDKVSDSISDKENEWARRDSNTRPPPCQGDVITN